MSKKSIERKFLAAAFFASAARKVLPEIQFIESGQDQLSFYYDFYLPYPISENHLEELERIANKISSESNVSFKEMLIDNAKNYLEHLGQVRRVIDSDSILVQLIEIDGFTDYIPCECTIKEDDKFFIKLNGFTKVGEDLYRVSGLVFEDSKECFKFLKKLKDYEKNNFLTIGKKRKWFDIHNDLLFFYPKGVILKNKILKLIADEMAATGYKPFQSYPTDHLEILKEKDVGLKKIFEVICGQSPEILEDSSLNTQTNILVKQTTHIFNNEFEDECISYLQSIVKMLNILGFRFEFELCVSANPKLKDKKKALERALLALNIEYELHNAKAECELKVFASDRINRKWNISTLKLNKNSIESNFCSSLNRWAALVVESENQFFGVLPEHIRLVLLDERFINYAKNVRDSIEQSGYCVDIDISDKQLNEKIFDAKMQDVPFIGVIGEKEATSKTIALRFENGQKMQRLELCELLEKLKQKDNIENQQTN